LGSDRRGRRFKPPMDIQSDRYPRRIWSSPGPFFEGFHLGLLGAGRYTAVPALHQARKRE